MTNTYNQNTDRIEQMIDECGSDLSPADLANCFHQAFLTQDLREMLGADQVEDMYYAMMVRLYRRIHGSDSPVTYFDWLQENNYVLAGTEEYLNEKERLINKRIAAIRSDKFATAP